MAPNKFATPKGKGPVATPGKGKYVDYYQYGWWQEPEAPPDTTASLDLSKPQTRVERLLLRANLPSTIRLTGPTDLLFNAFGIRLTARSLLRNLALPAWGSTRAVSGADSAWQEILLAAPARIEAVGVRSSAKPTDLRITYKEGYDQTYVKALNLNGFYKGKKITYSGYHEQAVVTQSVKLKLSNQQADILLSSPSLPSRVALALGDDTPAQLFPAEMEADGTVASRDLTGQINAAWRRGAGGETAEVLLRITSLTDGIVAVDLSGAWGRYHAAPAQNLTLDSVNPAVVEVDWPFGPTVDEAQVSLHLTGKIEGGRRMGLVPGASTFHVRVTERLEVAQAVRVASGEGPAERREVLAVWLMLPRLPRAEERLEIRLAEAAGDPPFPADEPLARLEVTLPVDAGAYVALAGGYWYRAALEKPVPLDGTQATSPLFLVAAGREGGSLLAHRGLGVAVAGGERVPAAAGAGISLVRNLDRTGTWEAQGFSRQAAQWLVDLELAPVGAEYQGLIGLAYGNGPFQALPIDSPPRLSVQTARQPVGRPSGEIATLTATLVSAVRASLTAQLFLYKSVLGEP